MPRHPHYLLKPATIAKSDIAKYAAQHGKANSFAYTLDGKSYAAGSLRFDTFAGARCDDGLYRGRYRFLVGDYSECETFDFNSLPEYKPAVTYRRTLSDSEAT